MFKSHDSISFGYDEFFVGYLSVPYNRGLMELSQTPLVSPSIFSAKDPRHVCLAALHGHAIYPIDERTLKERVKDGGPYAKTLLSRMELFAEMVSDFNCAQRRVGTMSGAVVTIVIDDDDPFTLEQFENVGLGGTEIAEAALQYEEDRQFFSLGQSGRLNHFARHYGFPNVEAFKAFINRLDDEAALMGFSSYATICVATRYMDHVSKACTDQPNAQLVLEELGKKRSLLQRESVFIIERFVACRVASERRAFFVDVNDEGVLIALHKGRFTGTGIVMSQYLSDRNPDFHRIWFS
ncbi:hypothetical protein H5A44_11910 [Pectobacterium brasiliense]|uniref:hypothetical protein n=1 Tax=Pectobacterium brasiliense TaxID=180957 RepID=UPI00196A0752|nr:hypothetical protein [Pectobacterium brasiliense]MBN3343131.1 hypothetical protein [Pectobacterium brasiliense]